MQNKYSKYKIAWNPDKLKSIRDGVLTAPIYVRIKPTNRCQHSCHFCCIAGTKVLTSEGEKNIEEIKVGDKIQSPDGTYSVCVSNSKRDSRGIYKITANGHSIEVTADHPFLTKDGWIQASDLSVGDSTFMQVRVRTSSKEKEKILGGLHIHAPEKVWAERCGEKAYFGENEKEQSNEKVGNKDESFSINKRNTKAVFGESPEERGESIKEKNVFGFEPNEKSVNSPSGIQENISKDGNIKIRGQILELDSSSQSSNSKNIGRIDVYREEKSRLQNIKSEESDRIISTAVLQQQENNKESGDLRESNGRPLQAERVELSCRISAPETKIFQGITESDSTVCIEGIKLLGNMELREIDSIDYLEKTVPVYNLHCPPSECFIANSFVVHNCVYASQASDTEAPVIKTTMHSDINHKSILFRDELMQLIFDLAKGGTKCITFSGGGEPLTHPDIVEAMELAKAHGLEISIITNGQSLSGEKARALYDAAWVRVSMDYSNEDQFVRSRGGSKASFHRIIENLVDFKENKRKAELTVNYIVTRENYKTILEAVNLLSFVDNIRFSPVWTDDQWSYHKAIYDEVKYKIEEAQRKFKVKIYDGYFIDRQAKERKISQCYFWQISPVVGADGGIYACHNKAYAEDGRIGSIRDGGFFNSWGKALDKMRGFNACETCKCQCANESKNILIHEIMEAGNDDFI